jgi:ubiquinone/menaquinone biosynthesis C-methylase UbiE
MISLAKERFSEVCFKVMDILYLHFEDETFDGIWASCCLLHVAKKDIPLAFAESFRVLKKNGVMYVLVK